jgi:hypothetical protein
MQNEGEPSIQYNYKEITYKSFNMDDSDFVFLFKRLRKNFKVCFLNTFVRYISGNKVYEFYTNDNNDNNDKSNEMQGGANDKNDKNNEMRSGANDKNDKNNTRRSGANQNTIKRGPTITQKINVYEKTPIEITQDLDDFHVVTFHKHKIPYYLFPSDNAYDDMHHVNKYIIRIHNNIYLNFETITYTDETHVNKIFINYNRESKLDESLITKLISDVQNSIKENHRIEVPIF